MELITGVGRRGEGLVGGRDSVLEAGTVCSKQRQNWQLVCGNGQRSARLEHTVPEEEEIGSGLGEGESSRRACSAVRKHWALGLETRDSQVGLTVWVPWVASEAYRPQDPPLAISEFESCSQVVLPGVPNLSPRVDPF